MKKDYYGAGSDLMLNTTVFAKTWERKKAYGLVKNKNHFS
jgi:hypothetical protein